MPMTLEPNWTSCSAYPHLCPSLQTQHADDRVPQMVRALGIGAQQRTQLSQLRRLFLTKLAKIVEDRKAINAQLLVRRVGGLGGWAVCND